MTVGALVWPTLEMMRAPQRELPAGWQVIRPSYQVNALATAGDLIWAGGKDGVVGLDRVSGNPITHLVSDQSLTYVRALLVDRNGTLWIGHQNGLTSYDGTTYRTYAKEDGLPDNHVNTLLQDRDGRLWIGTSGGAAFKNGTRWQVVRASDGLADDNVNAMLEDGRGGIWFGSNAAPRGGISYLNDGRWQLFSTANGLPHNTINAFFEDQTGHVWAGTGLLDRGGAAVFTFTGSDWTVQRVLTSADGLASNAVRSIFQDRDSVFWIGSESDGLARLDGENRRVLTVKDGLPDPEITCILQDKEGSIWIGTLNGIARLNVKALNDLKTAKSIAENVPNALPRSLPNQLPELADPAQVLLTIRNGPSISAIAQSSKFVDIDANKNVRVWRC